MVARIQGKIGFLAAAAALSATACLTPQSDAVTSLVADEAAATVMNSSGGDVYLAVETAWETVGEVFTRHGTCQVNTGDALRTQTCTIRIPESQLYYGRTKFVFGTGNASMCHRVAFYPAVWQMSNSNTATLATDPTVTVDCSASSLIAVSGYPAIPAFGSNLSCFHGPAKALYTDWPQTAHSYIRPVANALNESSEIIESANSMVQSFPVWIDLGTYATNLVVANKLDNTAANVTSPAGSDVYLANTMSAYRVKCLDQYEQTKAEVIVNVADTDLETGEDPASANNDQFWDFDQTL